MKSPNLTDEHPSPDRKGSTQEDFLVGQDAALPTRAALGTMHGKEAALSPSFADIGVYLAVPRDLNTDAFGTFTGETARAGTMIDAARSKAKAAATLTGLPVGIASEGSYGPHPSFPLVPIGRELILWHDTRSGVDIIDMIVDESPSFAHCDVKTTADAETFLNTIEFPYHALVVQPVDGDVILAKGVRNASLLGDALRSAVALSPCGLARIQTDMRAHMNPRRMAVIGKLGKRFAKRLTATCPRCNHPGWGWVGSVPGLRCSECGSPTQLPSHDIKGCVACDYEQVVERSSGERASSTFCSLCNP